MEQIGDAYGAQQDVDNQASGWRQRIVTYATRNMVAGIVMTVGFALGTGEAASPDLNLEADTPVTVQSLPEPGQQTCPEVSQQAIDMARLLMNQPAKLPEHTPEKVDTGTYIGDDMVEQYNGISEAAAEHDLTVYDPYPYMKNVLNDYVDLMNGKPSKIPYAVYYDDASAFLSLYNVNLVRGDVTTDPPTSAPSDAALDSAAAKEAIVQMAYGFGALPKEYVQLGHLDTVGLVANKPSVVGYTSMQPEHNFIALNVDYPAPQSVIWHELGHDVDSGLCGGATTNDPQFTKFNKPYDYDPNFASKMSAQTYDQLVDQAAENVLRERQSGDFTAACADQKKLQKDIHTLGNLVTLVSDYAGTEKIEDKAEEFSFLPGGHSRLLDPNLPLLEEKFSVLAGRLLTVDPDLAYFFLNKMARPQDVATGDCHQPLAPTK